MKKLLLGALLLFSHPTWSAFTVKHSYEARLNFIACQMQLALPDSVELNISKRNAFDFSMFPPNLGTRFKSAFGNIVKVDSEIYPVNLKLSSNEKVTSTRELEDFRFLRRAYQKHIRDLYAVKFDKERAELTYEVNLSIGDLATDWLTFKDSQSGEYIAGIGLFSALDQANEIPPYPYFPFELFLNKKEESISRAPEVIEMTKTYSVPNLKKPFINNGQLYFDSKDITPNTTELINFFISPHVSPQLRAAILKVIGFWMNEIALEQNREGNLLIHAVDTLYREKNIDRGVMLNYYTKGYGVELVRSFFFCQGSWVERAEAVDCLVKGIPVKKSSLLSISYEDFFKRNAPELVDNQ